MNILVTLDRNYLQPLSVMLTSLLIQHPGETMDVYLLSDDLQENDLSGIRRLLERFDARLHAITVPQDWFAHAPTLRYYSRAMYYRLLSSHLLPQDLDRILYLDPDMLILNDLTSLYRMPMNQALYAACIHKGLIPLSSPVNKIRLSSYESEGYFNSGMLLMNLEAIRREVRAEDVFAYAQKHPHLLILPDQDILNALYGSRILSVDETLYNYDARKFSEYLVASSGEKNMRWVMQHTAVLHFCGKRKPWHPAYAGQFAAIYAHYMALAERYLCGNEQEDAP